MPEPQLSVRSARARDLAHELARKEHRSIARVVEQALEQYADQQGGKIDEEPAAEFFARLRANAPEEDIDLETIIKEGRQPHKVIDL